MTEQKLKLKILCIDDESDVLEAYKGFVENLGFEALLGNNGDEALALVKEFHSEIILTISDYKMPDQNGLEVRKAMLPDFKLIPFAIVSGVVTKEMALKAVENKICAFLDKPFGETDLAELIEKEAKDRIEAIQDEQELTAGFLEESGNLLEELEPLVLSLENDPHDRDAVDRIFGILHTIKGTSGFFEPDTINKFAHKFEDFLSTLKSGANSVNPQVISILLKGLDILTQLVDSLRTKTTHEFNLEELITIFNYDASSAVRPVDGSKVESPRQKKAKAKDWVRTPLSLLDRFMKFSGDLTVIRNMVNKIVGTLERNFSGDADIKSLGELLNEMYSINSKMQNEVMELRKVSLGEIYRPLKRTVRDLSGSLKKEINLNLMGEGLRVDTSLTDVLSSSVIHMVRNCMDHGIEFPDDRVQANKPRAGTITLSCEESREEVIFRIIDDGRGMNPEKIKLKLIEKGLYTEKELEKMPDRKILEKIFDSGFSTAEKVTDVSGRGVGMDQVKASVEKVGGRIEVDSELGKGTQIALYLPIPKSVQIITSLCVEVQGLQFAIPRDNIERIFQLNPDRQADYVRKIDRGLTFRWEDGSLIPLLNLRGILNVKPSENQKEEMSIVVVKTKTSRYGLVVDSVLDTEETVVKPLHEYLLGNGVFMSTTFQGNGMPGLILDVEGIARSCGLSRELHRKSSEASSEIENEFHLNGIDESTEFLLFEIDDGKKYALPLGFVHRLERVEYHQLETLGEMPVFRYGEHVVPVFSLSKLLNLSENKSQVERGLEETFPAIVVKRSNHYFAFEIEEIVDVATVSEAIDNSVKDRPGVLGNLILDEEVVVVIDVWEILSDQMQRLSSDGTASRLKEKRSSKSILYAEDVDFYRDCMARELARAGYQVTAVSDGKEVLERLKCREDANYSLVLLDTRMPKLSGFEVAERVRADEDLKTLPIVALTGRFSDSERKKGQDLNFAGYLEKLDLERVIDKLDNVLQGE